MKKSVGIFGVTGQDGSLLAKLCLEKKFQVIGVLTRFKKDFRNLDKLKITKKIKIINYNKNYKKLMKKIFKNKIKYIFYFSGISSIIKSNISPYESILSHNVLLVEILEYIRKNRLNIKVFNACSGEIFAGNLKKNNEKSKLNPINFYGLAKSFSFEISKIYREQFNLKIYNGIFLNHESNLRSKDFVIKKIVNSIYLYKKNKIKKIKIGNIEIKRDWGWAEEFMQIIFKFVLESYPSDLIIATGKITSVKNIIDFACRIIKINPKNFIEISKKNIRKNDAKIIRADITKMKNLIKTYPRITIKNVIKKMLKYEFNKK